MPLYYADTSALVKLVKSEAGSETMRRLWTDGAEFVSSLLAKAELLRAVRAEGAEVIRQARTLLAAVDLLPVTGAIAESAVGLDPAVTRTLDALHVASALALGPDLDAVITYDGRLADAARRSGLEVLAPAP
ncbi:MAG: type II toxin-antitoxin system VapC family toxin [Bifidobacteriaceae bacterium]|jgi:predicted nucleic acid-binding protein|nr:type II toxin-antitoxin system VapC family toxin [Bifidobacteriaceae bacterium]